MRKLITAAVIAIGSLAATAAPSFADSFSVTVGQPGYHHRPYYGHSDRYYHSRDWYRHRPVRYDCRTKTVRYHEHGRVVTRTTRVCD
ncbi:hypothetical protein FZ934_00270 [Rhizobium grahamii]|uniref:Uncharacterized protein n=1 Tax=Rhizobium grahamii TaxID=1120045 RepID=A0A5Q0BZG7_9HYPH|nr:MULTISPECIES: hypothetical protein [Rhizobium]QFY59018.1 hypothetical protein FZ934_00270 [Rhizobium grahamii]QRM48464.1 hypothetical protein F3Y33_03610 [Rhizobium sp. BG6]